LIWINASAPGSCTLRAGTRESPMSIEFIIIIGGISAAFAIFAVTLCWADLQTRDLSK